MTDISKPSDRFAKLTLSRSELAKAFLLNCLPQTLLESLDFDRLEVLKDTFVGPDLKEVFSDLLYRVPLVGGGEGFVYVLLEHKSAPDRWVAFQLLRYMVRIWESFAKKSKGKRLPPIIPIVFYQGRPRWNLPRNFASLVEIHSDDLLSKYTPDFEYQLYDLANYDAEKFKGDLRLRIGLQAMKSRLSGQQPKTFREFLKLAKPLQSSGQDDLEYLLAALTHYSLTAEGLTKKDLRDAVAEVLPERKELIMSTVAQELREEARQEGLHEGKAELTLAQLQRQIGKVSVALRKKVLSLSSQRLQELGLALLDFRTQKDLSNWLAKGPRNQ